MSEADSSRFVIRDRNWHFTCTRLPFIFFRICVMSNFPVIIFCTYLCVGQR